MSKSLCAGARRPSQSEIIHGVLAILRRGDRFLLIQRAAGVRLPGVWCFPGGQIEPGEAQAEALIREMREELGIGVEPIRRVMVFEKHGGRLVLNCWTARCLPGRLRPNAAEVAGARWMTPRQIRSMRLAYRSVPLDGPPRLISGTRRILTRLGV